jgi:iron complex transport system substrate-binding protein
MKKIWCIILVFLTLSFYAEEFRIVSLSPAMTEVICQLGLEKNLIARSEVCNYPESVKNLPIAGAFAKPNVEKILTLNPTHIITNDLINPNVISVFGARNIKTLMVQCNNLSDYQKAIEEVGQLFGVEEISRKEIEKISIFRSELSKPLKVKALWVVFDNPIMVAGANSLPDEVLRFAGAENLAGDVKQSYFKCSFDWLWEQNPDVIIYTGSPQGWKKKIWQSLPAVKNNKIIYDINHDIILRPGPRIFEGILELRKKLENMQ